MFGQWRYLTRQATGDEVNTQGTQTVDPQAEEPREHQAVESPAIEADRPEQTAE